MTAEASALGALIDAAEVDWLQDALHAITGICAHHPGALSNQVIEALFYELAPVEGEDQ